MALTGCTAESATADTTATGEVGSSIAPVSTPPPTASFGGEPQSEPRPEPCEHLTGSGELAGDIVATWFFTLNASPWSITLMADGTARGTAGSDIVGATPQQFDAEWSLGGTELTILGMHSLGPDSIVFFDETEAGWRVGNPASPDYWRRCG